MATLSPDTENDVQVTFEDQQKINRFARYNARLQDIKEEIVAKKKGVQNLEDATDELVLLDSVELIPYQIGEIFISCNIDDATRMIENGKEQTLQDIKNLGENAGTHKRILADLKVQLYAKFGTNINLEAEEES